MQPKSGAYRSTAIRLSLIVLLIAAVIATALLASVPPVSRDALTHHLAVPKLYLQHGGIYEIPHLNFSYYPMNLDLLYMIPLYFKNDILPKFIHFAFALATAAMLARYLHRRINMEYALLGALYFLTIPVVIRLSSTVYVDLGLICFLFASLLFIFRWMESGFKPGYLLISAVFCGLGTGTKYNGLVGLFLLGLFVAFVYARYHSGEKHFSLKSIGWCAAFVMAALILFSPWMIRNFVWTGNPVHPLYENALKTENKSTELSPNTRTEAKSRMSHIQIRQKIFGESWAEIALIPLRVFFQGKDDNPRYFDGKLNPFLLFLPVLAFLGIRSTGKQVKSEKFMMLLFSVFFLLYACAQTSIRIRYFSPILPPLVILSMFGLYNLQTTILQPSHRISNPLKKTAIFGVIAAMLGFNAVYMVDRFQNDHPIAHLSGDITRDQYIQTFRPEYAAFHYANENLSRNDKILGFYIGNRGYYSDIPIEFSITILQKIAAKTDSGKAVAKILSEKGFTHLLLNISLFSQYAREYSMHEKKVLKEFFEDYTVTKFSEDEYGLLWLKQPAKR